MKNIKKIFNAIKLNKYKPSSTSYFDPVRKYFVQKTPEEAIRQKTIKFLEEYLGIPLNRLRVEESMAHVKLRAKGRADIVVYRDDNKNHPLMVIECKAPEIDISCEEVREQAERYRNILKADYIMLING
ncbi:MAG: type I restriction enzyme HsdR N-terminal domain-containing protein, partial [Veillonella sp.]|nr:type I restriction enzyme HsdR N-terminal domain-containing protein [Veillonella sp.]